MDNTDIARNIPKKPGLWWAAFDDDERITEIVLIEIRYYSGTDSFDEGAVFRVIDGSMRDGSIVGNIRRPIVKPSWDIVLAHLTRATVDEVRITWLREQKVPRFKVSVGDQVPALAPEPTV